LGQGSVIVLDFVAEKVNHQRIGRGDSYAAKPGGRKHVINGMLYLKKCHCVGELGP
jgi:hypothetical protein